jgi:succinyl-CoA synthetase beta subunit
MEIEEVAAKHPDKILRQPIDPAIGFRPWQARSIAYGLGLSGNPAKEAAALVSQVVKAFHELDCSLLECNPLVVTKEDHVMALDAKMTFDDNASFRHPELLALRDLSEEDPAESEAKRFDLSFIKLDGTIGCMVNGAGLAMATMDIIKHHGGMPANFLDVGGGATADKVTAAFKIITKDPRVRGIFINIFGGIMKCDTIAEGVVAAVKEVGLKVPLVVRLEGTNVELGKKILGGSGLNVVAANDMSDGAKRIVELAR